MSQIYDNWETLVGAVLRRGELRQLALCASMDSCSISSSSSSFNHSFDSTSQIEESYSYEDNLETSPSQVSHHDPINEKISYTLGARELLISWADTPDYWKWTSHADSRSCADMPLTSSMDSWKSSSSSSFNHSFNSSSQIEEFYNYEDNLERSLSQLSQGSYPDPINEKNSYMLGARKLLISWADFSEHWKWTSHADSRFPEAAELLGVWLLDIRARIRMRLLSPDTTYAAFLVFKLAESSYGLESANAIIKFPDIESDRDAERRALVVHLQLVEDRKGEDPVSRDDGWMEVELGKFYTKRDDGVVEARLLETKCYKTGLIVKGIEFRPAVIESPFVLRKRVARRNWDQERIFQLIKTENSTIAPVSYLRVFRVRVSRGNNLAVRDQGSIRPYVVLKMGNRKLTTRVSNTYSNPEWHEDLTFVVPDTVFLVSLTVRSYNKFLTDSKIGNAEFDVKPMIEASAMDMEQLPNGTIITTVRPSTSNCLAEESCLIWENGKLVQDLHLKLKNVKSGAVMIQLQWIHVPGWRAH